MADTDAYGSILLDASELSFAALTGGEGCTAFDHVLRRLQEETAEEGADDEQVSAFQSAY